jgi:hypothetical protein
MDAFARGLKIAAAIRADGALQKLLDERYASWSEALGRRIDAGSESFETLEKEMLAKGNSAPCTSGRQELFENLVAVARLDGVDQLVGFFDQVLHERLVGLLGIPRAATRGAQFVGRG